MINIIRLPDEPIIIVTPRTSLTDYFNNLSRVHPQINQIANDVNSLLYEIIDVRQVDVTYCDILIWLNAYRAPRPGSAVDVRVCPVIVGDHPLIDVGIKKVYQQVGLKLPRYDTLDDALIAIRAEISHKQTAL